MALIAGVAFAGWSYERRRVERELREAAEVRAVCQPAVRFALTWARNTRLMSEDGPIKRRGQWFYALLIAGTDTLGNERTVLMGCAVEDGKIIDIREMQ